MISRLGPADPQMFELFAPIYLHRGTKLGRRGVYHDYQRVLQKTDVRDLRRPSWRTVLGVRMRKYLVRRKVFQSAIFDARRANLAADARVSAIQMCGQRLTGAKLGTRVEP